MPNVGRNDYSRTYTLTRRITLSCGLRTNLPVPSYSATVNVVGTVSSYSYHSDAYRCTKVVVSFFAACSWPSWACMLSCGKVPDLQLGWGVAEKTYLISNRYNRVLFRC